MTNDAMTNDIDSNPTEPSGPPKSFEESLEELRCIVNELEEGSLGLENSLRRFEQGMGLLQSCYRTLERAEQKIEILTGSNAEGQPLTEPFDATATAEQSGQTAGRRKRRPAAKKQQEQTDTPEQDAEESSAEPRLFS